MGFGDPSTPVQVPGPKPVMLETTILTNSGQGVVAPDIPKHGPPRNRRKFDSPRPARVSCALTAR